MNCDREQAIITTADELLSAQKNLDEPKVDSAFVLRFDPICEKWLRTLRKMMRQVIGLDGDEVLPDVEAFFWQEHLERHRGLQVSLVSREGGSSCYSGEIRGQGYQCLNMDLITRLQLKPGTSLNLKELEEVAVLVGNEAWSTAVIQDEIERIAIAYGVSPDPEQIDNYSPADIKKIFATVVAWITIGKDVPSFRWKYTQLIERNLDNDTNHILVSPSPMSSNRRAELVNRMNIGAPLTIKAGNGLTMQVRSLPVTEFGKQLIPPTNLNYTDSQHLTSSQRGNKRITLPVRIRTRAVYYLSKRGGGQRTATDAVLIWNENFPCYDVQEPKNYHSEIERLFARGSIRRVT